MIASHRSITGATLCRHPFNGSSVGLPLLAWRVGPVGCPGSELAEASGAVALHARPRPGWGLFFAPIRCMWSAPWREQLIDGAKTDEECHSEPSGAWRRSFSSTGDIGDVKTDSHPTSDGITISASSHHGDRRHVQPRHGHLQPGADWGQEEKDQDLFRLLDLSLAPHQVRRTSARLRPLLARTHRLPRLRRQAELDECSRQRRHMD